MILVCNPHYTFFKIPEKDAFELGAHTIVFSTDEEQMPKVSGKFDLIIDTVPYVHDTNRYIPILNINGTIVLVGDLGPLDPMLNTAV